MFCFVSFSKDLFFCCCKNPFKKVFAVHLSVRCLNVLTVISNASYSSFSCPPKEQFCQIRDHTLDGHL